MSHPAVIHAIWVALGLLAISGLTVAISRVAVVDLGWLPVYALARAVAQLAFIAFALRGILAHPLAVVAFIALMLTTASLTAGRRVGDLWQGRRASIVAVVAGSTMAVSLVFAFGLVPHGVRYLVAVGGIVIGNTMTAVTLAGRNYRREAVATRDQIEGWLSLGATPHRATRDAGRLAVRESLIPTLDQTKATGLVTLPGAFVGALFGGLDPVGAAVFQLVVLSSVALAMLVAALVVTQWVGRSPVIPVQA